MNKFLNIFKIEIGHSRIWGLDILRCFAIMFIVVAHGSIYLPASVRNFMANFIFDGVSIFFVLSGYLIGGVLIKEFDRRQVFLKRNLLNFWLRRWFRTLPNYLLILLVLVILNLFFTANFSVTEVGQYFVFAQNLFTPHPGFFPEAWSLSVEEWFYLLMPMILLFGSLGLKLSKKKSLLFVAIFIIISITGFRYYRYLNLTVLDAFTWENIYRKQVFMRLDALMYGVIGAYFAFYHRGLWVKYKKLLFALGLSSLVILKFTDFSNPASFYWTVISFSLHAIATLLLMPYLSDLKKGEGLVFSLTTYISLISYSMYLLNLTIVQTWIIDNINFGNLNQFVANGLRYTIFWLATVGLSIVVYKYYEVPMTKLRDHPAIAKFLKHEN